MSRRKDGADVDPRSPDAVSKRRPGNDLFAHSHDSRAKPKMMQIRNHIITPKQPRWYRRRTEPGLLAFLNDRGARGARGDSRDAVVGLDDAEIDVLVNVAVHVALLGAVTRDVAELAASVALHGLRLAVAGKVVGSAALVAAGRALRSGVEGRAGKLGESTAVDGAATGNDSTMGVGASALQKCQRQVLQQPRGRWAGTYNEVTGLAALVASTSRRGTAKAECRAVGLNVAEALAVVALLRVGAARERAIARLVVCCLGGQSLCITAREDGPIILGCLPIFSR